MKQISDQRVQELIDRINFLRNDGPLTPISRQTYDDLQSALRELIDLRRREDYVQCCLL